MSIRAPVQDEHWRYKPTEGCGRRQYSGASTSGNPWAPRNYKGITSAVNPLCRRLDTATNTTSRRMSATDVTFKGCGKSVCHGYNTSTQGSIAPISPAGFGGNSFLAHHMALSPSIGAIGAAAPNFDAQPSSSS